jgi:hypothetical protein
MDQLAFGPGGHARHGDQCRDQLILSIPSVRVKSSPSPTGDPLRGLRRTKATAQSTTPRGLAAPKPGRVATGVGG